MNAIVSHDCVVLSLLVLKSIFKENEILSVTLLNFYVVLLKDPKLFIIVHITCEPYHKLLKDGHKQKKYYIASIFVFLSHFVSDVLKITIQLQRPSRSPKLWFLSISLGEIRVRISVKLTIIAYCKINIFYSLYWLIRLTGLSDIQ